MFAIIFAMGNQNQTPEHFTPETSMTPALEAAWRGKDSATEVRQEQGGAEQSPMIDVHDIPGLEAGENAGAHTAELGVAALHAVNGPIAIPPENVTPEMRQNALGSPFSTKPGKLTGSVPPSQTGREFMDGVPNKNQGYTSTPAGPPIPYAKKK